MFDFSKVVDRHGTWCTQWDYVADRFGSADLLPFTISDMDFATAPCILEALAQRLSHGVLGYSRWKNDEFLAALGCAENIVSLDNCITRLRLSVKDMSLVNVQALKDNRAIGVVQLNQHNLQVVIGPQVQSVTDEIAVLMNTVQAYGQQYV